MSMGRIALVALILVAALACAATAQHAKFKLFDLMEDQPEAPADPDAKPGETAAPEKKPWDVDKEQLFVHPVSAPYYHEDSFVTSDVRLWYLYHKFSKQTALGGGHLQAVAVQARIALTDRFQFVANKSGYSWWDEGLDLMNDGCHDIGFGLKWNFLQDWDEQMHAAVGVGYEVASGRQASLHDDEEWRLWGSFNKGFGALHLGGTVNFFYAPDKAADSPATAALQSRDFGSNNYISWHAHADYRACNVFSPVVEMSGYHVVSEGAHNVLNFQGTDAVNVAGGKKNYVITTALGGAFRPGPEWLEIRGAYEFPISNKDDIWRWRATLSAVISF